MRAVRRGLRASLLLITAAAMAACQPASEPAEAASIETPRLSLPATPDYEPATASSRTTASFDYWVLALSWSPEFCASNEARPNSRQCSGSHEFIVHGLWPQFERGYPAACESHAKVSERTADRLAPLVPDRGLVFHQWKKHGTCSGLSPDEYFATLERAGKSVVVPSDALRKASQHPAARTALERAFTAANPGLGADAITFECRGGYLREVRICLDLDLKPRACGRDVNEGCGNRPVNVRPVSR